MLTKARASFASLFIFSAVLVVTSTSVLANIGTGNSRCGHVIERSLVPADFEVNLTDKKGKNLVAHGYPKTLIGVRTLPPRDQIFDRFVTWNAKTELICFDDVFDARNTTIARIPPRPVLANDPGGPEIPGGDNGFSVSSDLLLEAVSVDNEGRYVLNNIFESISGHTGIDFPARIPDLYLLDANGLLVPDSILYGIVDFNIYLHNIPSFDLGDIFAVANGINEFLPGMMFSLTPFEFDAKNGFTTTGPLFTGNGFTLTEHELQAVPEPDSLALFVIGLLGLFGSRKRKLKLPGQYQLR